MEKLSIAICLSAILFIAPQEGCAKKTASTSKGNAELKRLYAEASRDYQNKNYSRANAVLSKIIANHPGFVKARFARAEVLFAMERFEDTLAELDSALKLEPRNADGLMTRANASIELGNRRLDRSFFDRAVKDFTRVIELQPKNDVAYNNRGLCYSNNGDYQKALRDWEKACQLDPREPKYFKNRATAYGQLGDYENAKAMYEKARSLQPDNFYRYYDFGRLYLTRGEPQKAIDSLNTCIKLNRSWADAYVHRGLAYFDLEKYQRAISDFTSAINLNSKLKSCYRYRGLAYSQLGDTERASKDLEQFSDEEISKTHFEAGIDRDLKQQGRESIDSLIAKGLSLEQKGNFDGAIEKYSKAISIDRHSGSSYKLRAHAYLQRKDLDKAIADYDMALWVEPFDSDALLRRALVYDQKGFAEKALWDLNRAITTDPVSPDSYYEKAKICQRLKKNSEASLNYRRFLKLALFKTDKSTNQKLSLAKDALKQLRNASH